MVTAEGKNGSCCMPGEMSCCKVELIVSVDERGQMVLPKEIRERAKIGAEDKLAVVEHGEVFAWSCHGRSSQKIIMLK